MVDGWSRRQEAEILVAVCSSLSVTFDRCRADRFEELFLLFSMSLWVLYTLHFLLPTYDKDPLCKFRPSIR